MKVGKSILSALFGSLSFCVVGIFIYMVLLPAIAFFIVSRATHSAIELDNPKMLGSIALFSVFGGMLGWSMRHIKRRR
jgi:uncharacterized oligopeptide transporter (OPT) family protein